MPVKEMVSVICIAFNHEKWIERALNSVLSQDYHLMELLIVDNGSRDLSSLLIQKWFEKYKDRLSVRVFFKPEPEGYCKLFNEMLQMVDGEFVIDLSGDDLLYPSHITLSISRLKSHLDAAFSFSDAWILYGNGSKSIFYPRDSSGKLLSPVREGEIYELLIRRSHICSPSVVFRTEILKKEGGYDSNLSYEDFDIQLRLSRKYPAVYSDHIGVAKQKHSTSLSASQYSRYQSRMLPSTLQVCKKIMEMNNSEAEKSALRERVLFELKHALWSANFDVAEGFVHFGHKLEISGGVFFMYKVWLQAKLDISALYVRLRS